MLMPTNTRRHKPLQISYANLGVHRNKLRFWQEGLRLGKAGFTTGTPIQVLPFPELNTLILQVGNEATGTHKVSGRKRAGAEESTPIIDINNSELTEVFDGFKQVRIMYYPGKVVAQVHSQALNRYVGMEDLKANIRSGVLTMGSICVGGGICTSALKSGMEMADVRCESEWVIDIERKYLQSMLDNTDVASDKTTIIEGALGDVEVETLTPVSWLNLSLPCTGFSPAGRSKNKLENPESHKTAGTAILKALEIIEKLMPPIITNENVVAFQSSASADLMAGRLIELGYHVESRVFDGEMGTLEDRKRSIMVASHPSLSLSMDTIMPVMNKEAKMADVLEDLPLDDPAWRPYTYLAEKEKRDMEAGKGFRRQLLNGDEEGCGVIGRGYNKARSTEPFIQHPENPDLSRLLTISEHAAVMKIPPKLVNNLSKTVAHEVMGQAGSFALFTALGKWAAVETQAAVAMQDKHIPEFRQTRQPQSVVKTNNDEPANSRDSVNNEHYQMEMLA